MKVVLLLLLSGGVVCGQPSDDVLELISRAGFTGEAHHVETEDGYILKVHRILPRGKPVSSLPVFLMHGMLVSSSVFIMSAPENSLGFLLADSGYDVWMGNTRGSKHSMNHTTLSVESREFWTFSFHEMGYYDLPAMLDFMLGKTGAKKFFYIGHSQGSTSLLVLLSMRPEYNEKVAQSHLMAPAVFSTFIQHPYIWIAFSAIRDGLFGTNRYLNMRFFWILLQEFFCSRSPGSLEFAICEVSALIAAGPNKIKFQMDRKVMQIYLRYMSPRMSLMQMVHYVQMHYSNKFESFDHSWKNFEMKNFTKPIEYNLLKVTAPTFLYAGSADALVGVKDTETLRRLLPNVKKFQAVDDWNHYDFTFSLDASLYKTIIDEMGAKHEINGNQI